MGGCSGNGKERIRGSTCRRVTIIRLQMHAAIANDMATGSARWSLAIFSREEWNVGGWRVSRSIIPTPAYSLPIFSTHKNAKLCEQIRAAIGTPLLPSDRRFCFVENGCCCTRGLLASIWLLLLLFPLPIISALLCWRAWNQSSCIDSKIFSIREQTQQQKLVLNGGE